MLIVRNKNRLLLLGTVFEMSTNVKDRRRKRTFEDVICKEEPLIHLGVGNRSFRGKDRENESQN